MGDSTPSELQRLADERAATQSKIREAYKRVYNNPFRQTAIVDPAVFRYEAARAYAKEFYKHTPRSLMVPIAIFAGVVLLQMQLNKDQREKEEKIRSGNSTYAERARYSARFLY